MDAVEFNKEFSRFCSNHVCSKCPIKHASEFHLAQFKAEETTPKV